MLTRNTIFYPNLHKLHLSLSEIHGLYKNSFDENLIRLNKKETIQTIETVVSFASNIIALMIL